MEWIQDTGNETTMRQRRVGQRWRHRKGRWYDNNRDSDSNNSTITIGWWGGDWDRDGVETNIITNTIKIQFK